MHLKTENARQKILIVEDDEKIRRSIKRHLSRENYEIREAENGKTGLDVLADFAADLILLDVMMPILNGYEMCKQLKSSPHLRDIFVLMISAQAKPEDKTIGLDIGADDYLTKPFDPGELLERIKKGLTKAKAWKDGTRDANTGLFNRSFFTAQLAQEIAFCSREASHLSVLLGKVDLDSGLAEVFGPAEVVQIQKTLAGILLSNSRLTDTCAQWDATHFIVLLRSTSLDEATQFGERIRQKTESHDFQVSRQVTVSLGTAEFQDSDVRLIKAAATALRKAEQAGGNRIEASAIHPHT